MRKLFALLAMTILFLTLTFLSLSITPSLAADIEVIPTKIEWRCGNYGSTSYKACVVITNHTNVRYQVYVKLTWYDSYGYKVHYRLLSGSVRPYSRRILCVYGGVDDHDVEVFDHLEAVIDSMWEVPK